MKKRYTSYARAVEWIPNNMVLCNEIVNFDESIFDNANWDVDKWDDIYQFYITDFNEDDVKWLQKTFPQLLITYSDKLNCFILCVTVFGESWHNVIVRCKNDSIYDEYLIDKESPDDRVNGNAVNNSLDDEEDEDEDEEDEND